MSEASLSETWQVFSGRIAAIIEIVEEPARAVSPDDITHLEHLLGTMEHDFDTLVCQTFQHIYRIKHNKEKR